MATIEVTALSRPAGYHGSEIPGEIAAYLTDRPWPGGGTVKVLRLHFGLDMIQIWPANSERIRELGEKLIRLARELEMV